jgi:His-Xaa-Ser system protein HxsD
MKFDNIIKDDEIQVFADSNIFSKDSIFKCLYWFGDKFHTSVAFADSQTYCISLKPLSTAGIKLDEFELYQQKLERDLIDFQLRETISKETQNIRDLLVAKAFSNGEFDEDPPGNVSDPIGFNPNIIAI